MRGGGDAILGGHPHNQGRNLLPDPRAAWPPWRERPLPGDQLPVPSQDRVGVTMVATCVSVPFREEQDEAFGTPSRGPAHPAERSPELLLKKKEEDALTRERDSGLGPPV
jgi:hypothetical protein